MGHTPLSPYTDDALLALRFSELPKLGVTLEGTAVEKATRQLTRELRAHRLRWTPHFWLADEWFTPDGVPGIAIPFYLAHPRLLELERRMMGRAEGETADECLKILRHEAGHAIENAYRTRRRPDRRDLFGPTSRPYPKAYSPQPASRRFVRHLPDLYAQSHPDEDFAETFAVWLDPKSKWRKRYADWTALSKLEYVDRLVRELAGQPPKTTARRQTGSLAHSTRTLAQHYRRRMAHYKPGLPDARPALVTTFGFEGGMTAERFLRRIKGSLRRSVAASTGARRYDIDRVVDGLAREARALGLRAQDTPARRVRLTARLVKTTANCLYRGHHLVPL